MVNPQPRILVDNVIPLLCYTKVDDDGRPVLRSTWPTLLDSMSITWGRDDVWSQPEPAVCTLTMWEPAEMASDPTNQKYSALWKIVNRKGIRGPLVVQTPRNGNNDHWTIFRGYITNIDVKPLTVRTERGPTEGWAVRVQGSDRSAFFGQESGQTMHLNRTTMQERAVDIRIQGSGTLVREIYFEDQYKSGTVKAIDISDKSILDLVNELYASFADQWTYNPHRNVAIRIPSGSTFSPYTLALGITTAESGTNTVRLYPPRWVDPTGKEDPQDQDAYPSGYIGGADVAGDVVLSSNAVQNITHIACKWFNAPGKPPGDYVTNVAVDDTPQAPKNTLRFDSWYDDGKFIDPIVADVKTKCLQEGARPLHPRIEWDTAKAGDVPDWQTWKTIALSAQTIRMVCLAGSPFSAATGYAPVWHPSGGTTVYEAGQWRFTLDLAPAPFTLSGNPITFAGLAGSNASTLTLGQLDKSITSFDMQFCSDATVYDWSDN